MQAQETSLKKYIAIGIVVCYVISFTLNTIIDSFIKGNHYTATTTASLITASFAAGYFFFKDHKRASSIEENARYSFHTMLWGVLIPLALLIVGLFAFFYYYGEEELVLFSTAVFVDFMREATLKTAFVVAFVCSLFIALMGLYYMAIRWAFSWYTKKAAQQKNG